MMRQRNRYVSAKKTLTATFLLWAITLGAGSVLQGCSGEFIDAMGEGISEGMERGVENVRTICENHGCTYEGQRCICPN